MALERVGQPTASALSITNYKFEFGVLICRETRIDLEMANSLVIFFQCSELVASSRVSKAATDPLVVCG